jgi:hypothetical protein
MAKSIPFKNSFHGLHPGRGIDASDYVVRLYCSIERRKYILIRRTNQEHIGGQSEALNSVGFVTLTRSKARKGLELGSAAVVHGDRRRENVSARRKALAIYAEGPIFRF